MPKLTKQKGKKDKSFLTAFMLKNDEAWIPLLYFDKVEATISKKDWADNWDEHFNIVKVLITPLK